MLTFALVTAGFSLMLGSTALFFSFKANVWTTTESQRVDGVKRSLDALESSVRGMGDDLPESKLTEVEALVRALKSDFGQMVTQVEEHRAGVHRSMQRFDQIMRRDERAIAEYKRLQQEANEGIPVDDEPENDGVVDQLPQGGDRSAMAAGTLAAAHQAEPGSDAGSFRRELQRQYFANRGIAGRR